MTTYTYTQSVVDSFTGTTLNTSVWVNPGDAAGTLTVSGGALNIGVDNSDQEVEVDSVGTWNLATGIWGAKWSSTGTASPDTAGYGQSGTEVYFGLWSGNNQSGPYIEIQTYPGSNTWYVIYGNGSAYVTGITGGQNAFGSGWTQGNYWGIGNYNINNDGMVQMYSSPDGQTWTEIGAIPIGSSGLNTSSAGLYLGTYQHNGTSTWVSKFQEASYFARSTSTSGGTGGTGGSGGTTSLYPTTVAGVVSQVPWLAWYPESGSSTPDPSTWPSPNINMAVWYQSAWNVSPTDYGSYAYVNNGQTFFQWCAANSCVPYFELEPWNLNWTSGNAGVVPFSTITSGTYDSWLEAIGTAIAAFGKPVILTFAHEFNTGGQYPWSWQGGSAYSGLTTQSGTSGAILTPAQWIAGWKYVHDKIRSTAGGWDVWMWAPGAGEIGGTVESPAAYWPGTSYVDMVGLDGYPNSYYGAANGTFAGNIQPILSIVRGLGWTNPVFISETNLAQMVNMGGQDITSFVADMAAAGVSGIVEWENSTLGQNGTDYQMTASQWTTYDSATAIYYASGATSGTGGGTGGTTTPPPAGNPAIATLTDSFPGTSLNTSLWSATGATVTVGGGILTIPQTASYPTVSSNQLYDLQGSMVFVKMTPDTYDAGSNSGLNVMGNSGNVGYGIAVTAGTIYLQGTTAGIDGWSTIQSISYNATAHAWIGVSESGGTLFFQASPDSITWTTLFSVADGSFPITAVQAVMWAGN